MFGVAHRSGFLEGTKGPWMANAPAFLVPCDLSPIHCCLKAASVVAGPRFVAATARNKIGFTLSTAHREFCATPAAGMPLALGFFAASIIFVLQEIRYYKVTLSLS